MRRGGHTWAVPVTVTEGGDASPPPMRSHRGRSWAWAVLLLCPLALSSACGTLASPPPVNAPPPPIATAGAVRDPATLAPIQPDRPDVTNGTSIVDVGLLQIEAGAQHERMGANQQNLGTPLSVRIGLFEWLEARVSTDGFLHQHDAISSVSGLGNVQVGAKLRLFADPGGVPVLSILPTVNLPVASASKGLGSGDPDVTLVLLTGTDLGRTSHVDLNYGIGAIGAGQGRPPFTQQLVSVSFSHSVTEQLSPYIESYWFSRQDPAGGRVLSIDAGLIQAFTARLAVDGGVTVGLTNAAPHSAVFGGLSIIVGDVLGDHGVIARQRRAARLGSQSPR
jgi:Putative MetA-pathway of phenol degradation